jgi:intracellular septation protein A
MKEWPMSSPSPAPAKPASGQSALAGWVPTIVMNIVLPTVTYFVLVRSTGLSDVAALLISGVWPVIEIVATIVRQRHVDEFSVFVIIGIAVAVVTALLSHSARSLFFKDSITTGLLGLVFLGSLLVGRPLTFYFGRRFATDGSKIQRDWWNGLWQYPQFRAVQRRLATYWGVALVGEAAIRAILTKILGTSPMVLVNNIVPYVVIALLVTLSVVVGRRAQARAAARGVDTTPPAA